MPATASASATREKTAPHFDSPKRLYPLREAFHLIGVGNTKGFQLLKEGRLKAVTVLGRRMVSYSEIERVEREGA